MSKTVHNLNSTRTARSPMPQRGIPLNTALTKGATELPGPPDRSQDHHWKPPFMPWFETDFQGSLRVRKLPRVARWIYGDLLRAGWHCDTAPYLPNDDDELRTICDCPPELWEEYKEQVLRCFTPTPDEKYLYHPKMVREYNRALTEHQRKVAGGRNRWQKPLPEAPAPEVHTHEHNEVHLHQHHTSSRSENTTRPRLPKKLR